MKTFLDLFVTVGGAIFVAQIVQPRVRQKWFPYAFAYLIWWALSGSVFMLFVHILAWRVCWGLNLIAMAVVLSEFRQRYLSRNPALLAFLLFFSWFTLAGMLGEGPLGFKIDYHFHVLRMIAIGLVAGFWIMERENGFDRFFTAVAFAVFLSAVEYILHGSWNVSALADAGGRMVLDTGELVGDEATLRGLSNVNRFALLTSMALPYPFLALFENVRTKHRKVLLFCAAVACLVLLLVLIKTGSRNGGISLLAFGWYFVFAKTKIKKGKKILIMLALVCAVGIGVGKFMKGSDLRVFKLSEGETDSFEDVGTGRGGMVLQHYNAMTCSEHWLGKGLPLEYVGTSTVRDHVANCHSIYLQLFVHSGYLGLFLFLLFCIVCWVNAGRVPRGSIARLFLLIFVLTGVGEAANLAPGSGYAKYGLGIALALCCRRRGQVGHQFGCYRRF